MGYRMTEDGIRIDLPDDVLEIFKVIKRYGATAYVVGGCVRDSLMNREPHDWDICTPVPPSELQAHFEEYGYEVIPTGIKHGTITVIVNGTGYEITTFRKETDYSDGRHPDTIEYTSDLEDDLSRRDFTMNAMAYNHEEGLIDPFYGREDILMYGVIRTVENPVDRFSEDYLRILRMWRFSIQFGFNIEKYTLQAALELLPNIKKISKERVRDEFVKALSGNPLGFIRMSYGKNNVFLLSIIPEFAQCIGFEQHNPYHSYDVFIHSMLAYAYLYNFLDNNSVDLITKLAALFHDIGKPHCYSEDENGVGHFYGHAKVSSIIAESVLKRLRFDNDTVKKVCELILYHDDTFNVGKKYARRWLNKIGEEQYRRLLDLRFADISAQSPQFKNDRLKDMEYMLVCLEEVLEENSCFSMKDLAITGKDIMDEFDIPEGKKVGKLLHKALSAVIDGDIENNKEDLLTYLGDPI